MYNWNFDHLESYLCTSFLVHLVYVPKLYIHLIVSVTTCDSQIHKHLLQLPCCTRFNCLIMTPSKQIEKLQIHDIIFSFINNII